MKFGSINCIASMCYTNFTEIAIEMDRIKWNSLKRKIWFFIKTSEESLDTVVVMVFSNFVCQYYCGEVWGARDQKMSWHKHFSCLTIQALIKKLITKFKIEKSMKVLTFLQCSNPAEFSVFCLLSFVMYRSWMQVQISN